MSKGTIVVDPEDRGTQTGTMLPPPPGWKPTPIREQLGEPIDPAGECVVLDGKPHILFGMWDYAQDWSGEFVREVHPFTLLSAPRISVAEFWSLVRECQEGPKWWRPRWLRRLWRAGVPGLRGRR